MGSASESSEAVRLDKVTANLSSKRATIVLGASTILMSRNSSRNQISRFTEDDPETKRGPSDKSVANAMPDTA